jgi:hypothetical protein
MRCGRGMRDERSLSIWCRACELADPEGLDVALLVDTPANDGRDLTPEEWERFERAIDVALAGGPVVPRLGRVETSPFGPCRKAA